MTYFSSLTGYKNYRHVRKSGKAPVCRSCLGSTIGPYGEQCRVCGGKGFMDNRPADGLNCKTRFERFGRKHGQ